MRGETVVFGAGNVIASIGLVDARQRTGVDEGRPVDIVRGCNGDRRLRVVVVSAVVSRVVPLVECRPVKAFEQHALVSRQNRQSKLVVLLVETVREGMEKSFDEDNLL